MMIYFWRLVSSVVESVSYGPRVLRFDSRPWSGFLKVPGSVRLGASSKIDWSDAHASSHSQLS